MPEDFFDAATADRVAAEALVVDVDGFEGPIDLLLALARTQKVDLRAVSILKLAEQYLAFVEAAKRLRIELAADYLVMAAWLAFLKSRLLLPALPDGEPSGDELAAHLAFQLQRLEAMRGAAAALMGRDQLGRDVFARGEPQAPSRTVRVEHTADMLDLLRAYARVKTRDDFQPLHLARDPVLTMEMALERLRGLVGSAVEWVDLAAWLPPEWAGDPHRRRSAMAASFAAALELARAGQLELRQEAAFRPIFLRQKPETDA